MLALEVGTRVWRGSEAAGFRPPSSPRTIVRHQSGAPAERSSGFLHGIRQTSWRAYARPSGSGAMWSHT